MCVCIFICVYMCIYVCMCVYVYIYIYVYMYVYIDLCVHIYIYIKVAYAIPPTSGRKESLRRSWKLSSGLRPNPPLPGLLVRSLLDEYEGLLGCFSGTSLEGSREHLRGFWGHLGGFSGAFWRPLGASWGCLGRPPGCLGGTFDDPSYVYPFLLDPLPTTPQHTFAFAGYPCICRSWLNPALLTCCPERIWFARWSRSFHSRIRRVPGSP